jgi:hypothetical protein
MQAIYAYQSQNPDHRRHPQKTGQYRRDISNTAIFRQYGVPKPTGERILRESRYSDYTIPFKDLSDSKETLGAPKLISKAQIRCIEEIIVAADVEERSMTWETLAMEAEIYNPEFLSNGKRSKKAGKLVSSGTIQRVMGRMDYPKCVACHKGWVSKNLTKRHLAFLKKMLYKYPTPDHWKRVRFSDEVYFSLGPGGKLMIIRKQDTG